MHCLRGSADIPTCVFGGMGYIPNDPGERVRMWGKFMRGSWYPFSVNGSWLCKWPAELLVNYYINGQLQYDVILPLETLLSGNMMAHFPYACFSENAQWNATIDLLYPLFYSQVHLCYSIFLMDIKQSDITDVNIGIYVQKLS